MESLHGRLRSIESDVTSMHEHQRVMESDMEVLRALVEQLQIATTCAGSTRVGVNNTPRKGTDRPQWST